MLVSACIIVYNHKKFLKACLEGVINQKVNFEYEIVIGDDCSIDNSEEICNQFVQKYPDLIRYHKRSNNLGMHKNWIETLSNSKGKYIAVCEGDDYWTDPYKLQKQVDFLEANSEFEVCFTNIKVIRADGSIKKAQLITDGRKDVYEQKDLPIWAPTLTRVFKNRDFQGKFPEAPGLDTVMLLYQSQFGKIKFINEVTGVYRLHEGGIHSAKSTAEKKERMFLTELYSLEILPANLLPKYFGMMLKKQIEIKSLDLKLYKNCHQLFISGYNRHKNQLTTYTRIKIKVVLILSKSLILKNWKVVQKVKFKFINKLLINRNN